MKSCGIHLISQINFRKFLILFSQSQLFQFISTILQYRTSLQIWNFGVIDLKIDEEVYIFSRARMIACFTNVDYFIMKKIIVIDVIDDRMIYCNIFNENDCIVVEYGETTIEMINGEVKIYMYDENTKEKNIDMISFTKLSILLNSLILIAFSAIN